MQYILVTSTGHESSGFFIYQSHDVFQKPFMEPKGLASCETLHSSHFALREDGSPKALLPWLFHPSDSCVASHNELQSWKQPTSYNCNNMQQLTTLWYLKDIQKPIPHHEVHKLCFKHWPRHTLPETNIAPENWPKPKRKGSSSNHPLSGANC